MLEKDEAMPIIETSSLPEELDSMRETATRDVREEDNRATAAVMAMKRMSSDAEKAGVADMTLEEINAEIASVRSRKIDI